MKKVIALLLAFVLLATSIYAAEPDGWDFWLYMREAGAGILLGLGGAGIAAYSGNTTAAYAGYVFGNAAGVLAAGEYFGAKSENWYFTYPLTIIVSTAYTTSIVMAGGATFDELYASLSDDDALTIFISISNAFVSAEAYNLVKRPVMPEKSLDTGFNIKPYATYLADSGGDIVPVYGVSVSF
ncbi:MAG: hypothetical protein GY771_02685 [bacterium]|nr:hypothetical protein [bacterium]